MPNPQRWLSLEGICTTLQVSHNHAIWLAKEGYLTVIWGTKDKKLKTARFLDPTPEYAAKLRLGEALYGRTYPMPKDLDLAGLLTIREVAEVTGLSLRYMQKYLRVEKIPFVRVGHYNLYSVGDVRDILWRRDGRKLAKQRAPFLIERMVEFFMQRYAEESAVVPTDAEFAADDLLQKKFVRIAKLPPAERAAAMKEFYEKVSLAKLTASTLSL